LPAKAVEEIDEALTPDGREAAGFVDRADTAKGGLIPRTEPNVILEREALAFEQAISVAHDGRGRTLDDPENAPMRRRRVRAVIDRMQSPRPVEFKLSWLMEKVAIRCMKQVKRSGESRSASRMGRPSAPILDA
jgi:hypothetical protein